MDQDLECIRELGVDYSDSERLKIASSTAMHSTWWIIVAIVFAMLIAIGFDWKRRK